MDKKNPIPFKENNPKGLHARYYIQKIKDISFNEGFPLNRSFERDLEPVDKDSEYFVMRLDDGGSDDKHIEACRKAVLYYAELIKDHLPELSKELIERYGEAPPESDENL